MAEARVTAVTTQLEWQWEEEWYVTQVTAQLEYEQVEPAEKRVTTLVIMVEHIGGDDSVIPYGPRAWKA